MGEVDVDAAASGPLLRQFETMRETELLLDLKIVVGEHTFKAHRLVIAIRVPEFCSKYASAFYAVGFGTATVTDMDFTTMSKFLDYIYTGKVITKGNVFDLYVVSEAYGLKTLKTALEKLAVDNFQDQKEFVTPRNCIPLWQVANKLQNPKMKEFLATYVLKNFESIPANYPLTNDLVKHIARTVESDQTFSELFIKCLNANRNLEDRMNFLKLLDLTEISKEELASITGHAHISVPEMRHILSMVAGGGATSQQTNTLNGNLKPDSEPLAKKLRIDPPIVIKTEMKPKPTVQVGPKAAGPNGSNQASPITIKDGKPINSKPVEKNVAIKAASTTITQRTIPTLVTFKTMSTIANAADKVIIQWTFDKNHLRNGGIWRSIAPHENICGANNCPGHDCDNLELVNSTVPMDFKNAVTIRVHSIQQTRRLHFLFKKAIKIPGKGISLEYRATEALVPSQGGPVSMKATQERDMGQHLSTMYSLTAGAADRCEFNMIYVKS